MITLTQSLNDFLPIDRKLLKKYGLDFAAYISLLENKYNSLSRLNQLAENEMFYFPDEEIFLLSGISYNRIKKVKKQAQELELISIIKISKKSYYKIDFNLLTEIKQEKNNIKFGSELYGDWKNF